MTETAPSTTGVKGRYTGAQVALHWSIVALVGVQFLSHKAMGSAFRAMVKAMDSGLPRDPGAILHAAAGLAILLLMVIRLLIRSQRGAPPPPADLAPILRIAARLTHDALYALLILIPLVGGAAIMTGSRSVGHWHGNLVLLLWGILGLHVLGALFHLIRRDGVFRGIFVPRSRLRA